MQNPDALVLLTSTSLTSHPCQQLNKPGPGMGRQAQAGRRITSKHSIADFLWAGSLEIMLRMTCRMPLSTFSSAGAGS